MAHETWTEPLQRTLQRKEIRRKSLQVDHTQKQKKKKIKKIAINTRKNGINLESSQWNAI